MTRKAVVTASDSGIGKATAVALARRGCDVGITWHEDRDGAEDTAAGVRDLGCSAHVMRLDLSRNPESLEAFNELVAALGGIDVLVNNAGRGISQPVLEQSLDDWRDVLEVNLTGAFLCGQAAAKRMVADGTRGRIVNVTSVHEHVPKRGSAAYCASKGGLGLLTKVMALELAEHGITVNAVAPGEIATPMTGNEDQDPTAIDRPAIPATRPGDAREVAELIAHLASDEASYTTGASFVIDGGLMLMAAEANQLIE
ncbi:MAG: SDR family oxidoreductase [Actinomycetota bacterium]|nr:SDR family oxidoreductase [Actinomycetota bacterium]